MAGLRLDFKGALLERAMTVALHDCLSLCVTNIPCIKHFLHCLSSFGLFRFVVGAAVCWCAAACWLYMRRYSIPERFRTCAVVAEDLARPIKP